MRIILNRNLSGNYFELERNHYLDRDVAVCRSGLYTFFPELAEQNASSVVLTVSKKKLSGAKFMKLQSNYIQAKLNKMVIEMGILTGTADFLREFLGERKTFWIKAAAFN